MCVCIHVSMYVVVAESIQSGSYQGWMLDMLPLEVSLYRLRGSGRKGRFGGSSYGGSHSVGPWSSDLQRILGSLGILRPLGSVRRFPPARSVPVSIAANALWEFLYSGGLVLWVLI